jgi:orotate phosphoribosyltransferase
MRSKDHYRLETRQSANAESVKQIYEASFFPSPQMEATGDSEEGPGRWAVDLRVPLAKGRLLRLVAKEMAAVLAHHSVNQIAGAGYGAFLLIGGVLISGAGINGGLIRESRKPYGFRRIVEGGLNAERPVFIVDDILSSGRSALRAAILLRDEGFRPVGVLTVFRYGWKKGLERLQDAHLVVESLATLHHRREGSTQVTYSNHSVERRQLDGHAG